MKKRIGFFPLGMALLVYVSSCAKNPSQGQAKNRLMVSNDFLVDSLATPETVSLFKNLQDLALRAVLFGHQDDLAYGIGWWALPGKSDVKAVCGDYPAVYGWDIGDIQNTENLDGVSFNRMKSWIIEVYLRGGINTISMHLDNPVTSGTAWDTTPAVASILPEGSTHEAYLQTLDRIAAFLSDLRTQDGVWVPIILRPYHEHNHNWAWWGSGSCTAAEYRALWRMTVEYLRDAHQLHHLLYAFSPQEVNTESDYFMRYPGDDFVDIFGLDYYRLWQGSAIVDLGNSLRMIVTQAKNRNKIAALTEVGVENVPDPRWWTDYLLASIQHNSESQKICWTLVWRNASEDHHFAPYPGHPSAANFLEFYSDPLTFFEKDLPDLYHE
jgi:mannan endo-1,4-beta-mannosidase